MKYKIYKQNITLLKPSKKETVKIKQEPILINEQYLSNVENVKPSILGTKSVILNNKEYIQEKVHTQNEIITSTKTYKEIDYRTLINHNYRILFDSKKSLNNHINAINTHPLINDPDITYDCDYKIKEVKIPNSYKLEDKELINKIDNIDQVIEEQIPYFLDKEESGLLSKEEVDQLLQNLNNDIDITIESTSIKPVRDKSKDVISVISNIVDEKEVSKYLINKKSEDETVKSKVEQIESFKEENYNYNFKNKEECLSYIDKIKETNDVLNYIIKPLYRKRKIDEYFNNKEDALVRKNELKKLYSNITIEIEEVKKDEIVNSVLLKESYFNKNEALDILNNLNNDGKEAYIVTNYKEEMLTINNEIFKTENDALKRVNELENISETSIHYAITKVDNYYYCLSGAYYGYKEYYNIKLIDRINVYIYHLFGFVDDVYSYDVHLTINNKIIKYKVSNEINKLGYNYKYEVKYKKKYYKTIYNIKSHKTIYNLMYKGIGYKDKYITKQVEDKIVNPIYTYETKVKDIVIKKTKEQNNKTYMKIA